MDLASLIIGVCLSALFIGPLVYATRAQKRKDKQLLTTFSGLAKKQNLTITRFDLWSNFYVIGIDMQSGKIFYLKKRQDIEQEALIDLSGVAKCRIGNLSRSSKNQKENINVVYRLELIFTYHNPAIPERSIEFFNGEESMCLNGELPLIEKWLEVIHSNLKGKPSKKAILV